MCHPEPSERRSFHPQKKHKAAKDVKAMHIKNHLWVFVNALIENPAFDSQVTFLFVPVFARNGPFLPLMTQLLPSVMILSQTKATLTLNAKSFGSTYVLSEKATKQGSS